MRVKSNLVWLLVIPLHAIVALAYLEDNSGIHLPPATSTACVSDPDPNNFLIQYANPECVPKWRFWYTDPVFHTTGVANERIMRLTDAFNIGIKGASHVYSSINAFNLDKTKIIVSHRLLNGGEVLAIYDIAEGTYTLAPPGISTNAQPRWSRNNPDIIYLMPPFTAPAPVYIKQYYVSTGIISNVGGPLSFNGHTYDSIIEHPTEDDICFGGDHLVKRVSWQGIEYVVVFSISQQRVVAEYPITGLQPGDYVDNVEIAAAASAADRTADRMDIVLVNFVKHESSSTSFNTWGRGMWKFTFDESQPAADRLIRDQQVVTATTHHDTGRDDDGTPILVTPNGSMYNPVIGCQGGGKFGLEKISLVNPDGNVPSAQRTISKCLMNSLDWATQDVHVSLGDQAGWAFLDVNRISPNDTPTDPDPTGNWKPYANEIVQVKLDGTAVRRLAHHRARLTNQWYNQPVASVSRDGRTLAFVSNFGYGNYDITQYNDVYIIDNIDIGMPPAPASYKLSVTGSGTGTGTVTSNLPGIHCGTACSADYNIGTEVMLTASANAGSTFAGWTDACTGAGDCIVTMDAAKNVGAIFNVTTTEPPLLFTLQVTGSGTGTGTVTSNVPGIHCGTTCSADYISGTQVTLTASANAGSTFAGWGGACNGTSACIVAMDAAKNVGAAFTITDYIRVEQTSPAVTYTGNWFNRRAKIHSSGSAARALLQGNRAVFTFTGTSARWIGFNDPQSGIANVYVDSVLQAQIDTYYNDGSVLSFQAQHINYTTPPLAAGTHTLVIEVSGTRNPNSRGNSIWVDAFEYQP